MKLISCLLLLACISYELTLTSVIAAKSNAPVQYPRGVLLSGSERKVGNLIANRQAKTVTCIEIDEIQTYVAKYVNVTANKISDLNAGILAREAIRGRLLDNLNAVIEEAFPKLEQRDPSQDLSKTSESLVDTQRTLERVARITICKLVQEAALQKVIQLFMKYKCVTSLEKFIIEFGNPELLIPLEDLLQKTLTEVVVELEIILHPRGITQSTPPTGETVTPPAETGGSETPTTGTGGTVTPPTGSGGTVTPPTGSGGTVTLPTGSGGTVTPPTGTGGTVTPPVVPPGCITKEEFWERHVLPEVRLSAMIFASDNAEKVVKKVLAKWWGNGTSSVNQGLDNSTSCCANPYDHNELPDSQISPLLIQLREKLIKIASKSLFELSMEQYRIFFDKTVIGFVCKVNIIDLFEYLTGAYVTHVVQKHAFEDVEKKLTKIIQEKIIKFIPRQCIPAEKLKYYAKPKLNSLIKKATSDAVKGIYPQVLSSLTPPEQSLLYEREPFIEQKVHALTKKRATQLYKKFYDGAAAKAISKINSGTCYETIEQFLKEVTRNSKAVIRFIYYKIANEIKFRIISIISPKDIQKIRIEPPTDCRIYQDGLSPDQIKKFEIFVRVISFQRVILPSIISAMDYITVGLNNVLNKLHLLEPKNSQIKLPAFKDVGCYSSIGDYMQVALKEAIQKEVYVKVWKIFYFELGEQLLKPCSRTKLLVVAKTVRKNALINATNVAFDTAAELAQARVKEIFNPTVSPKY